MKQKKRARAIRTAYALKKITPVTPEEIETAELIIKKMADNLYYKHVLSGCECTPRTPEADTCSLRKDRVKYYTLSVTLATTHDIWMRND